MKKIRLIIMTIIIFVMCLFIAPSILNALPAYFAGTGHYYTTIVPGQTWTVANNTASSMTYKPDANGPTYYGHLVTINSQEEQDFIYSTFHSFTSGTYSIGAYQTGSDEPAGGWHWVTGEAWQYTNWGISLPDNAGGSENWAEFRAPDGSWNDVNDAPRYGYIVEFEPRNPMTCYQVWVNAKGNFEFLFWYLYADSNWIKIYDKSGKEVYSMNIPIDKPDFEVALPDGIYTVKTFTEQGNILQTFIIGKDATTPHRDLADLSK